MLTRRATPPTAAAAQYALVAVAGVLSLPLLCARRISSLRRPAQLSTAATVAVVAVVVLRYLTRPAAAAAAAASSDWLVTSGRLEYWGEGPSTVLAVPCMMLSLTAHVQAPSIYAGMAPHARSPRAMATAVIAAYALITVLYLGFIVVAFGSLSVRRGTWAHLEGGDHRCSANGHDREHRHGLSCGSDSLSCGADSLLRGSSFCGSSLCGNRSLLCGGDVSAAPELVAAHACLALSALVSAALSHHPAREALWRLARRGHSTTLQTSWGFSDGDIDSAPMPRRTLVGNTKAREPLRAHMRRHIDPP